MKSNMKADAIFSIFLVTGAMSSPNTWKDNAAKTNLDAFRTEGKKTMF